MKEIRTHFSTNQIHLNSNLEMSEKRKLVWLDCDPGHDDAMAIILAGHNKSLKLLGISTVAGNQTVEKTSMNALKTLHIAGLDHIDVSMGQSKPLLGVGKMYLF